MSYCIMLFLYLLLSPNIFSTLKRMSVIVSKQDSQYNIQYLVMCKGAPEVIKTMLTKVGYNRHH